MVPLVAALVEQGLDLVANFALAKGKDVLEKATGVKLPEDGKLTGEQIVILKKYQMDNEEHLAALRLEDNKLSVEKLKIDTENTEDARDMNVKLNESPYASWMAKNASSINGTAILWLFIVFCFLSVFKINNVEIDDANFNTVFMALYGLATLYAGYLWGASKPQKDISINGAAK